MSMSEKTRKEVLFANQKIQADVSISHLKNCIADLSLVSNIDGTQEVGKQEIIKLLIEVDKLVENTRYNVSAIRRAYGEYYARKN